MKFTDFLRLPNLFGHPSQVRAQVLVLQICVDLPVESSFGQGFSGAYLPPERIWPISLLVASVQPLCITNENSDFDRDI